MIFIGESPAKGSENFGARPVRQTDEMPSSPYAGMSRIKLNGFGAAPSQPRGLFQTPRHPGVEAAMLTPGEPLAGRRNFPLTLRALRFLLYNARLHSPIAQSVERRTVNP